MTRYLVQGVSLLVLKETFIVDFNCELYNVSLLLIFADSCVLTPWWRRETQTLTGASAFKSSKIFSQTTSDPLLKVTKAFNSSLMLSALDKKPQLKIVYLHFS